MNVGYTIVDSPLGRLLVAATTRGVCAVAMGSVGRGAAARACARVSRGAVIAQGPRRARRLDHGDPRASRRAPAAARPAARRPGDGVSVAGLERARRDPARRDALVRPGGFGDRPARPRHGPSPARARPTPSRWPFPVTASCRPPVASAATAGGPPRKRALLAGGLRVECRSDDQDTGNPSGSTVFPGPAFPSYPRHRGQLDADVVIVGGGLTGCATAYACAAAGVKVVLVEAERIGRGSTGSSSGWIADDPGMGFVEVEKAIGLRAARMPGRPGDGRRSTSARSIRRLDLKCDFEPRGALRVAATAGAERRASSGNRRRGATAGLDAPLVNARARRGRGRDRWRPRPSRRATARRSIRIAPPSVWPRRPRSAARGCSKARRRSGSCSAAGRSMSRPPADRSRRPRASSPPARRRRSSRRSRGTSGSGARFSR